MVVIVFTILILLFSLIWRYIGLILSTFLTLFLRVPINVGGVRWLSLFDVRVKLSGGITVHVDSLSLHLFSQQFSKPFLISLGDVRIETEPIVFANHNISGHKLSNSSGSSSRFLSRLKQVVQYCGLAVNSVHLVVLEAVPHCMIHITIYELSIETFRSREGWQLEVSCRLMQGKALRRKGVIGRALADFALPFHLSIDVSGFNVTRVGLKIADPSINISSGIFELLKEHMESILTEDETPTEKTPLSLRAFENLPEISIDFHNCVIKYTSACNQSRVLCLQIREVVLIQQDAVFNTQVQGISLTDQLMKSVLKSSHLSLTVQSRNATHAFEIRSDSVHASLSLQDALWWRDHFEVTLHDFKSLKSKSKTQGRPYEPMSLACSIEFDSLICELVDADSFQSKLSVQFLAFSATEREVEFSIESLSFSAPGTKTDANVFDNHQWGQSVYIGIALVHYVKDETAPSLLICVDDCKLEWSDRLLKQIHSLLLLASNSAVSSGAKSKDSPSKPIVVQVKAKRAALFMVAKESFYIVYICDKLMLESFNSFTDFVISCENSKIGLGQITGKNMLLKELKEATVSYPTKDDGVDQPWRTWNQKEKDRRKAARRKQFEEKRSKGVKLVAEANMLCISLEHLSSATRDITISSNTPIYFVWSPLLHRILFHIKCTTKSAFTLSKTGRTMRKPPKVLHIKAITTKTVELDVELSGYHRMIWTIPSLNLDWNSSNLSAQSPHLTIKMNGFEIITATNINITKKNLDPVMDNYRKNFESLRTPSNKVWTWAADQFFFFLPFEFNFHEIFDEFINCIKWIKIVHQKQKKPFTADSPLPCDLRIKFEEVRLEMEDDPFENVLQVSHELKEDEVYECERRRQMLADRLAQLRKKANPLFPQSRMDELYASLQEKNSAIYIERWNKADHSNRSLFLSKWLGWEIRAFADISLHGTDACLGLMADFDPMSNLPTENLQFSTMWGRAVEFDMAEWVVNFKDYPMPYLLTKDMHFFGTLVGAEQFDEVGRSLRENTIHLPPPFETHVVKRNMSPLKFYYDMQCESSEFTATYGPCWEPCLSMISLSWNNISAPSRDPSPPLPFWDKMRFLLHGRFSWLSNRVITTMLASPDPYNTTETVEMCWDNYGLDWALGEVRIRSEFHVFMRTASKYDDSRILSLPDLKLKVELDWICGGDPHDHHSVVLCAPHKLPHYSTDHDSYRGFRSQHLDLAFSFEAAPGASSHEKIPNILLYANTFRCIEFLLHTLTIKNRTIKRGKLFGTPLFMKPQLSKHFRNVHIALNLPKFYITYWMSHSSSYGFRVISEGLNLFSSLRLSMHIETDSEITRRRTYVWKPQHVSATLWGTKVHVYGEQKKPSADNEENDDTLLLGLSRISYVRENNAGKENAVHRLTVHELKASCTEEIRDACLSIADGVHRAHMLRRILSNDAIKILKLHMEEDQSIPKKTLEHTVSESDDTRGHRRGYSLSDTNQSMLYQLIDEAGTKLIAHCEQATDIPADSLQGAILSTTDDVQMINWQIDLLNSQAVLKGCERDGFILITTSKASLSQKIHKCVWRNGQLLGKKSWSAAISGMQYFAPVGMSTGQNKTLFRWLPRELIEERAPPDTGADTYMSFLESGEAVGGIVEPDGQDIERLQLQRIVSRCSCQIYFCYFSEELKTDALEETGVPKVEPPTYLRTEDIGVDCLTLKHNMLEASTSSDQYEMVVDIVNNLVLFIDPKKKELAEHRRKIRFECYVTDMAQMRESIVEQQSQLRDIVSVVRSLERQIFYLDSQGEVDDAKRKDLYEEMEEYKNRQLEVSDQLYIYISCYKQRQVEATRAVVHCPEDDGVAAVARRFEVCFEDCIWRLTENDGQIALAETQIRNFLYTRIMRIDNSGEHLFEVGSIRVSNLLPDSIFRDTLHRDDRHKTRQPAIRLLLKDLAPVGGICVKEHFEVNIAPMVVQLTYQFFEKMMGFFFPGKNIHNSENLDAIDESTPKFSFTRRIAGTLSMRSSKGAQVDRKASTASGKLSHKNNPESDLNEIEKMRHRADRNNFFLYIKIPEVPFVVSYKGNKDKNIEDVDRFSFLFPLCEFHERNWTWLDLSLAIKSKCKGVLLQQFMRQKLLSNRLTGKSEPVEGITEEEKKRIALGTTSSIEKKKKR